MKNVRRIVSIVAMICILTTTSAVAQDPNTELMKKLYTKIAKTVSVGSNDLTTGETYLILANPGILLDPTLDYNTPAGRNRFARAIDKALNPSWIYGTRNYTVFDVYNRILEDHEAAQVKPTAEQIKQYKAACKVIFSDCDQAQPGTYSNAYNRYQNALSRLIIVSKQAEDYKRQNQTEELPPDMLVDLISATNDLELIGNRTEIETAIAVKNTFEHIDPNAWWGELRGKFTKNSETLNTNRFGNLSLYPAYSVWLDINRTWTNLNLTQSEIEQTTTSSHTHVGGGGGFSIGFWSVGADYENTENRSYYSFAGSNYAVSMELMRVTLDRPWMDEGVFESHAWKWLEGSLYDKRKISSGADATSGVTPPASDVMPFVPTGLLLARRVSLTANWSTDLKTSFDSHTSAGASVGWGPFSFGGRYDNSNASTYHKAKAAGNTISWDAPQILGFFVQVLPESPNPDECYKFPSKPGPLPEHCQDLAKFRSFNSWRPKVTITSDMLLDRAKGMLRKSRGATTTKMQFKKLNPNQ
jgi:hypothetical protein